MPPRDSPAPGIRWDEARGGWLAAVEVGTGATRRAGERRLVARKRFPDGTPLQAMREWQDAAKVQLRARRDREAHTAEPAPAETGPLTLQAAADAYLRTVTSLPSYGSRAADLAAWTALLGDRPIAELQKVELLIVWNTWQKTVATSTRLHRRTALLQCLALHDPTIAAMAREAVPWTKEALGVPRELPYPLIRQILDAMPASGAKAFVAVLAETGLPPQTLRRLAPYDVREDLRRMTLPSREKGAGAAGVTLPLTQAAAEAFKAYRAAGWRPVSRATLCTVWTRACEAVRAGAYPPTTPHRARGTLGPATPVPACTPYVLRHSFAGRVLDACHGDLQALKELLQHIDLETTLRYVRARAARAAAAAVDALDRQAG